MSLSVGGKKTSHFLINWSCGIQPKKEGGLFKSVPIYLGPDNIWFGNSAGLARKRNGCTFVGYVVVRTREDLRGHCWRSRSWSAVVRLACSMITGFGQPVLSALQAFLHYKPMMNPNLACHYTPLIKVIFSSGRGANEPLHCNYCRRVNHLHISIFHAESAHYWPNWKKLPVFLHSETIFYRYHFTELISVSPENVYKKNKCTDGKTVS